VIGMFPLMLFLEGKGREDAQEEDEDDDATSPTSRGGHPESTDEPLRKVSGFCVV
jgi:hypothetical protein